MPPAGSPFRLAMIWLLARRLLFWKEYYIMQVTIKDNQITITLPISKHTSKSGKSTVVATSGGNQPTAATVDGQPVICGVNCYIRKV